MPVMHKLNNSVQQVYSLPAYERCEMQARETRIYYGSLQAHIEYSSILSSSAKLRTQQIIYELNVADPFG